MGANSSRRHFLHGIGMGVATLAMTGCADTVKHPALEAAVIVFSDNVVAIIDVFDYVTTNDILFDAPAGNTLPVQDKMTTKGLERDNITNKDSTRKARHRLRKSLSKSLMVIIILCFHYNLA